MFCSILIGTTLSISQDLTSVQDNLKTVETGKSTFRQELRIIEEGLVRYSVVEVDVKGKEKETQYVFSFADIDENTVRAITKKDIIIVQLLVSGKQKLVQVIANGGDKITYASELQLMATDAENSRNLEASIKKIVPEAVKLDEKRLALIGYEAHLDWLIKNLGDVELPKKQIVQKLERTTISAGLTLSQTFNAKSKSSSQTRHFNLATLNPNSVGYRISGEEFTISVETRRGIKGVGYFEDGEQKNYTGSMKFFATSINNGKDIFKVLRALIPLAESTFEKALPKVSDKDAALNVLNKAMANVDAGEVSLAQNLSIKGNVAQYTLTETEPDASTEYRYRFNFSDINANNVDYNGQKDRLFVSLPTKKSVKFIQETKNASLQNYTDKLNIYFNTIEDALIGAKALKVLAENQEKKMDDITYGSSSASSAVERLKDLMKKVTIGEDTYDLFIELTDTKTNTVKMTTVFSNLKKSIETVQEFSLNDINPKNCKIVVKGKHVVAELNTNHLEKIIKTYLDGTIKPYQSKVTIETAGIEEARQIVGTIKALVEKLNG